MESNYSKRSRSKKTRPSRRLLQHATWKPFSMQSTTVTHRTLFIEISNPTISWSQSLTRWSSLILAYRKLQTTTETWRPSQAHHTTWLLRCLKVAMVRKLIFGHWVCFSTPWWADTCPSRVTTRLRSSVRSKKLTIILITESSMLFLQNVRT